MHAKSLFLTAGSSFAKVLSLSTDGEGEVGLAMELLREDAPPRTPTPAPPPPPPAASTLRELAGDTLLKRRIR